MADLDPLERVLNKTKEAQLDSPLIVVNPAPAPPPYVADEREEERRAREKAKEEEGGNSLADLMAKYATPQTQIQSEKANVVRKKK